MAYICVCFKMNRVPRAAPQSKMLPGGFHFSSPVSKHLLPHPSLLNCSFKFQAPGQFPGIQLEQLWPRTPPATPGTILSGQRNPNPGRIQLCPSTSVPPQSSTDRKNTKLGGGDLCHFKSMVTHLNGAFNTS